ncbi:hypothetical protein VNI00_012750 [Paramarasmius palmivorus]|uniref:DUF7330 domain-containing protein n=1 Tax=Paramarasmius palmivorus TaxID=297713 RepID=A0AAW0C7C1_9AGAR
MTQTTSIDSPPLCQVEKPKMAPTKTPTNYIRIVREKGGIEDRFIVDASINVKENVLPELDESERASGRRNLCVKTMGDCGKIDIDVEVKDGVPNAVGRKKVAIEVEAHKANALLRLHAPSLEARPLFRVHVTSGAGTIVVSIPRSTAGLVNITSTGRVIISDQLARETNTVNEDGCFRKLVVGPVSEWDEEDKDQFFIHAKHGRVYLRYNDELHEKPPAGLWAKALWIKSKL